MTGTSHRDPTPFAATIAAAIVPSAVARRRAGSRAGAPGARAGHVRDERPRPATALAVALGGLAVLHAGVLAAALVPRGSGIADARSLAAVLLLAAVTAGFAVAAGLVARRAPATLAAGRAGWACLLLAAALAHHDALPATASAPGPTRDVPALLPTGLEPEALVAVAMAVMLAVGVAGAGGRGPDLVGRIRRRVIALARRMRAALAAAGARPAGDAAAPVLAARTRRRRATLRARPRRGPPAASAARVALG